MNNKKLKNWLDSQNFEDWQIVEHEKRILITTFKEDFEVEKALKEGGFDNIFHCDTTEEGETFSHAFEYI